MIELYNTVSWSKTIIRSLVVLTIGSGLLFAVVTTVSKTANCSFAF